MFCNRTGIEDDLVYAGTSSVVGIKDGEVKVYGILGRGVKDLLVVDTQNGPFAKLIQRPETEDDIGSQVSGMSRKPRKSAAAQPSTLSRPLEPTTTINVRSGQRRSTPTPEDSLVPRKTRPKSPSITIPDNYYKPRVPSHGTPIEESPGVATPTCPSPTPFSHRPYVDALEANSAVDYTRFKDHDDNSNEQTPHIYGGQISIKRPDSVTESPSSNHPSEKYFLSDTQAPLKSPMAFRFPDVYKQDVSKAESPVLSALVKIPHEERQHTKTIFNSSMPYSPQSETPDGTGQSEYPANSKDVVSLVKSSVTETQDCTPPRPSSPKSRNASRTGRPLSRRSSEVEQPDFCGTVERLELMARRPGSSMESIQHDTEETRQGRARARKGSVTSIEQSFNTPHSLDKKLDIVSPRMNPMVSSPSIFSDSTVQSRASGHKSSERANSRAATLNGAIRPCPRAGVRSRTRSMTGHGPSLSHTRSGSTGHSSVRGDAKPQIEPDETRTLVWSELSKLVGDVLDQPQTRDVSRGRHRVSDHGGLSSITHEKRGAHSETRPGPRVLPRAEQRFASQVRSDPAHQASIRTIPAPNSTEAPSSPYNPDDEIVAEIIFHSKERTTQSRVNSPRYKPDRTTSSQVSTMSRSRSGQKLAPAQNQSDMYDSIPQKSALQEQRQGNSRPGRVYQRRGSSRGHPEDIKTYKAPAKLTATARTESNDSCPTMDGASILTLASQKSSPSTPPSRVFEPTTPKAMKFDPESGTILSSLSDPLSSGGKPYIDSLQQELMNIGILRPKSAVW